jgi:hypothetical protein
MRAFFADGVDKMHIPWAVEGLPALLHLSVFLFFGGLAIFLFNVDHMVFGYVIWWIGLFSAMYGLITVMPIIRHHSPYYSPLSRSAWSLYAGMNYVFFKAIVFITDSHASNGTWERYHDLMVNYRGWMLGGVEKAAEETVSERSSEIDIRIVDWTIGVLGEDESLEKFLEAIPGLFTSKLVNDLERDFPLRLYETFWNALDGFLGRTLSSNSVTKSVQSRRLTICRDIMSMMPCPLHFPWGGFRSHFDQTPEELEAMERWLTNKDGYVTRCARAGVVRNLVRMQERDDARGGDAPEHDLRVNTALGRDNVFLATLIDVSRRAIYSNDFEPSQALTRFDIHHTLPRLQHSFCTLWNDLVQEARNQGSFDTPVRILREIRHHYIALHQGTDAAPTAFSASTDDYDRILRYPSSYPLCRIDSHRPDSTVPVPVPVPLLIQRGRSPDTPPHPPSQGGNTVPQQANFIVGSPLPSGPTTPSDIGVSSQAPAPTSPALPVHPSPRPTDTSPPGAVTGALQDSPPAAMSSCPLEGTTTQRDINALCPEPDSEILFTSSMSCGAGAASTSSPSLHASSVPILDSPTPSRASPLPNPDLLASAPSAAEIAATSFAWSDGPPMPQVHQQIGRDTSGSRGAS